MKSSTVQTFAGLAACAVDLYSSSYCDDSRITIRDTNTGDRLEIEGITNTVLRGAVISYLNALGYRKEDAAAQKFLQEIAQHAAKALETTEA